MSPNQTTPALSLLANRIAIDGLRVDSSTEAEYLKKEADCLLAQGSIDAAVLAYRRAVSLHPDAVECYDGLAAASLICADFETAVEGYSHVLQHDCGNAVAWCNLGHAYLFRGSFDQGRRCFHRALALRPGFVDAHMGLALAHLTRGHFKQGWRHYDWRPKVHMSAPLWRGEPLNRKRILLHAEQGLGDTLQFVRYVPLVTARGGQVVLQTQPALRRLLQPLQGVTELISPNDPIPEVSCQCALPSLPRLFATDISTIPASIPYLSVHPDETDVWSKRVTGPGPKVGLAWAGAPKNSRDRHRSIPLHFLEPLFGVPGVSFFSLQKGDAAAQIQELPPTMELCDLEPHALDFADIAAAVTALDLVISVDTSIAHLAGALGKPVWILLPFVPDWRWLLRREDSPWYPTARLFRQTRAGSWDEPIRAMAAALQQCFPQGS